MLTGAESRADTRPEEARTGPPGFPASIAAYRSSFRNWSGEVRVDDVWSCAPNTPEEVVTLADWARTQGWRLRPRGRSHNWSPLVVQPGSHDKVVLVDTTRHLTAVRVSPGSPAAVTAQAGATVEDILSVLETHGYGLTAVPAPGDLTLGGVLAVGAHGTAVPARGENPAPGHTFGSVADAVVSLTAVVWDEERSGYVLRTFSRSEPGAGALLVHLGRAFIVEATLRVGANQRLRCVSRCDTAVEDVFAPPETAGPDSLAAWVERTGRAEAVWLPFTRSPWIKSWSVSPVRPAESREVATPYNYPFTDCIPEQCSDLLSRVVTGEGSLTPAFCRAQLALIESGLSSTGADDIWGWSKNLLLYLRPSTLRITSSGHAVVTSRANVQRVVSEFYAYLRGALAAYQAKGRYPVNGPLEVRVTGLDHGAGAQLPDPAVHPWLSAVRPRPDRPDWDVAIWFAVLTLPGTPFADQFYREAEAWMLHNYTGRYAAVRPEWSKGWGYTVGGAWTDSRMVSGLLPEAYGKGQAPNETWEAARAAYRSHDPHAVFSSTFLDALLP